MLQEPLIIAISASSGRRYRRSRIVHPVLGHAYVPERGESPTSRYFAQMGLQVSCFMPPGNRAVLFRPDLAKTDDDVPPAIYDRVERDTSLGPQQAALVRDAFLHPNAAALRQLMADHAHRFLDITGVPPHAHH